MADIEKQKAAWLKVQVEKALARIPDMGDANKLKSLHANIQHHPDLDDLDRERLNEATMFRLRAVSPALATRLGGPKDAEGRDFLEKLYRRASSTFDLSGNRVGQGVKTGGDMINGKFHVDVYVSYKTCDGTHFGLAWIQQDIGSNPYLQFFLHHVGKPGAGEPEREVFSDPNKAVERYLQELGRLIGSPKSAD